MTPAEHGHSGTRQPRAVAHEGLPFVRFAMIISSLTPLFLLWAVRGMRPIPDAWLVSVCAALIVLPNLVLLARLAIASRRAATPSCGRDHTRPPSSPDATSG